MARRAQQIRRQRREADSGQSPAEAGSHRTCRLTEKQFARLQELVAELVRLTGVPSMEMSPIHVRECVGAIKSIVLE